MGAYRFLTTWRLEAPADKIWETLQDAEAYPRWWPGVEQVEVLHEGAANGAGRRARVTMRGRLPYRLRFEIVGREVRELERVVIEATGSLQGSGRWELRHDAGVTTMTYSWEVATTKAWMNVIEPFARPALISNHHVVMRWGAEGLARHLGGRLLTETSVPPARARDWAPLAGLLLGMAGIAAPLRHRQSACRRGWCPQRAASWLGPQGAKR
ncbi:MAG TPA: SRPBCC family protein [Egibacteraceae bacterium]|nr:SRPBCC family protein [Egibacteraceae bacterium]